jgi:bifunctional non-homologous end joining protein LigD
MATTRKTTGSRRSTSKRGSTAGRSRGGKTTRTATARQGGAGRRASPARTDGAKSARTTSAPKPATRSGATRSSTSKPAAAGPATRASKHRATSGTSTPLAEYNAKRDFTRTREPTGKVPKARGRTLQFVIQKHEASHLHYDFRLELDGVMKSWAVPKGPSLDPGVRRLAMEVEDHPISYNTFEGTIPQGEYGGGTVMLWDRGTYEAEDGGGAAALRRGYEKGDLKFVLHGKRLHGAWVLVRMQRPGRPQWLLIKHRDRYADPERDVTAEYTTSVASRRSMQRIAAGGEVWHSNR